MKRFTLSSDQVVSVVTAMALVYDDCLILSECREDDQCYGLYELVPMGRGDGLKREEARTLLSNEGVALDAIRGMLQHLVTTITGEQL